MQTADVVIIGGGIVGSSIAWHLTHAGCKSVLVIERESSQGKGSTGKSMGGVRAQFSTPVNIQMSLYSIPFYARFEEVVGHPADYRPQGYLFLATKESHLAYLRDNFERQKNLGLKTARLLPADEIRAMLPQLRSDDVLGGSFCSTDGFVDPYSVMNGFMASAVEHGATLWKKTEVTGITAGQQGAFTRRDHAVARSPLALSSMQPALGQRRSLNSSASISRLNRCAACSCHPNHSLTFPTPRPWSSI